MVSKMAVINKAMCADLLHSNTQKKTFYNYTIYPNVLMIHLNKRCCVICQKNLHCMDFN